jgi:hypothetical protein
MTNIAKRKNQRSSGARSQVNIVDDRLGSDNLRDSPMMARLQDALEAGEDVGQYGRLTFVIVARHFMDEDEIVKLLAGQPEMSEEHARAMLAQVQERDYNPPKRERILEWQAKQDFQICPDEEDPNGCNVYRELRFPQEIYNRIDQFWEEKVEE